MTRGKIRGDSACGLMRHLTLHSIHAQVFCHKLGAEARWWSTMEPSCCTWAPASLKKQEACLCGCCVTSAIRTQAAISKHNSNHLEPFRGLHDLPMSMQGPQETASHCMHLLTPRSHESCREATLPCLVNLLRFLYFCASSCQG